jgi:hypothetical protein
LIAAMTFWLSALLRTCGEIKESHGPEERTERIANCLVATRAVAANLAG